MSMVAEATITQRTRPPFRADHVGSILRFAPLKDVRAKHAAGEISAAALKEVEDREIEKIIKTEDGNGGGTMDQVEVGRRYREGGLELTIGETVEILGIGS
jgi:hypothetical protein